MSDVNPPQDAPVAEPAATTVTGRATRRTAIIALVAIVVAAVLGGGAFAIYKVFFAGGPQPAEALPASTIAILTIDLNPSAGQKIAAIKTIRKFPALKKTLGLKTQDDLRRFIFDKATENTACKGLDYNKDVKPWIGKRAAVAAVDLGGKDPAPAIALQITDKAKAASGFAKIEHCADFGSDFGYAVGDDYLIASDSKAHAETILTDGKKDPLSQDADYKRWSTAAGDQGVVNFYISKKASDFLAKAVGDLSGSLTDGLSGSSSSSLSSSQSFSGSSAPRAAACSNDPLSLVKSQLKGFQGLAGTIRFADGGMELSVATAGVTQVASAATVGDQIAKLPQDTAVAAGFGVPKDYASKLFDSFKCGVGNQADDLVSQAEDATGLTLPADLQTLLGSALTLSVGGDAPAGLSDLKDLSQVPVGLAVTGDASKIKGLITKIEDAAGFRLSDVPVQVKSSGSRLVLSPDSSYAEQLLSDGSLGDSSNFRDAVPNAKRASGIIYVNFDSKWREALIQLGRDDGASNQDLRTADDNSAPLKSLGLSSWTSGGTSHFLLKLATN